MSLPRLMVAFSLIFATVVIGSAIFLYQIEQQKIERMQ